MSATANEATIKMIRSGLNRLVVRMMVIRTQRKLFGIAGDASIYVFSSLATHSLSVRIFWLKRMLLRLSCKLHPMICWIVQKSKDLIARQRDIECRMKLLKHTLDYLESAQKVN